MATYKVVLFSADNEISKKFEALEKSPLALVKAQYIRMLNEMRNVSESDIKSYTKAEIKERKELVDALKKCNSSTPRSVRQDVETEQSVIQNQNKNNKKKINRPEIKAEAGKIYYFYDPSSMKELFEKVQSGDEIQIHCEGNPMILSNAKSDRHILTAYQLAAMMDHYQAPKNKALLLNIMSCHSAVTFEFKENEVTSTYNMAQDISTALSRLGYTQWSVCGYTGYIDFKSNGDSSVRVLFDRSIKNYMGRSTSAPLDACRFTYVSGKLQDLEKGVDRANLAVCPTRTDHWNGVGCKKFRNYNHDDRDDFEEMLLDAHFQKERAVMENKVTDYLLSSLIEKHSKGFWLLPLSSKTAQEAFEEGDEKLPQSPGQKK